MKGRQGTVADRRMEGRQRSLVPLLAHQGKQVPLLVRRGSQARQAVAEEHKSHPHIQVLRSGVRAAKNRKTAHSLTERGKTVPSLDRMALRGTTTGPALQESWVGRHRQGTKEVAQSFQGMPTRRDRRGSL